jgi:pimeloyl-ACP methyl ester carboxylesterase
MPTEILFIHGSGDSSSIWQPQLSYLQQFPTIHSYAINLPGHGPQPDTLPPETSISSYSQSTLTAIRNELHLQRPILAGHSLGGAIALSLALSHPHDLSGLILIGTGARLRVLPSFLERARIDPQQTKQELTNMAVSPSNRDSIALTISQEQPIPPQSPYILYRDLAACNQFDITNRLYEISLPTLIICGSEDQLTPPKYSHFLHDHIPNSELHIIPNAGHYVMREQPSTVNALIKTALFSNRSQ